MTGMDYRNEGDHIPVHRMEVSRELTQHYDIHSPGSGSMRQQSTAHAVDSVTLDLCAEVMRYSPINIAINRSNGVTAPASGVAVGADEIRLIQALLSDPTLDTQYFMPSNTSPFANSTVQRFTQSGPTSIAYLVRFKRFAEIIPLHSDFVGPINIGDYVMAESKFGSNLGVVMSESWISVHTAATGTILRVATVEDLDLFRVKLQREDQAVAICREVIASKAMDMDMLDAEYQWDGEKLAFFFDSKKWVNYRSLISALQSRFHARICMIKITEPDLLEPSPAIMKCAKDKKNKSPQVTEVPN